MTYFVKVVKYALDSVKLNSTGNRENPVFVEYFENKSGDSGWVVFAETDDTLTSKRVFLQKDGKWRDDWAFIFKHKHEAIDTRYNPPYAREEAKKEEEPKKQIPASSIGS